MSEGRVETYLKLMDNVLEIVDDIKLLIKDQQYIDLMSALAEIMSEETDSDELTFGVMTLSNNYDYGLTIIWKDPHTKNIHNEHGPAIIKLFYNGAIRSISWVRHGHYHTDNDNPARIFYRQNGVLDRQEWYKDGQQHRDQGPAVITYDDYGRVNCMEWRRSNVLHHVDGPAVIVINNGLIELEQWWLRGVLHRDDDEAAVTYYSGGKVINQSFYRYGECR
jgi:hypothetical protein